MKHTAILFTLLVSLTALVQAGGRVGFDLALHGQDTLWAEDIFVTRKHRGPDYFDVFAPGGTFVFHSEDSAMFPSKPNDVAAGKGTQDVLHTEYRVGILGYQKTLQNGWYAGVLPSFGMVADINTSPDENRGSFVFDPGLTVGKQHTYKSMLGKTELFYHNGFGVRSAFQYPLLARAGWSVNANHTIAIGSYRQQTTLQVPHPENLPSRYACELFNGVRLWRGRFCVAFGHRLGLERHLRFIPFSKSLSEWNEKTRRGMRANDSLEAGWKSPEQIRAEQMPCNVVTHDVLGDISFVWNNMRLALHGATNLVGNRSSSVGLRVSYHF